MEYKIEITSTRRDAETILNSKTNNGWDLKSFTPTNNGKEFVMLFTKSNK